MKTELMMQIRDRLSKITDAVERLRKTRQQLEEHRRAGASDVAVASAGEKLQAAESTLTRLPGPSPNMLAPKALNNRLAALAGEISQGDARRTRQMSAVFEELPTAVSEHLRRLDELVQSVAGPTDAPTTGRR
jgi:hypothetical protein